MDEQIIIAGQEIPLGKHQQIEVNVAGLPSGSSIPINIHVYRAKKPGPRVLLVGGIHGDEINGVQIVQQIVASKSLRKIQLGTVIAIPLLNVYGFNNFSRSLLDGKDLNRSFPGSNTGSLASRVAYMMSNEILPNIDFGVDFHTGGSTIHNIPQLRVSEGDEKALDLARAFAPKVILQNKPIPRSHRLYALKQGKQILVFEGGESKRLDENSVQEGIAGSFRLLHSLGMLQQHAPGPKALEFSNSKWIRASRAGLCLIKKQAGQWVEKGDILAEIQDLGKMKSIKIKSPRAGLIIAHVNNPVVNRGDALFHLTF